jgi:hypothetical protein
MTLFASSGHKSHLFFDLLHPLGQCHVQRDEQSNSLSYLSTTQFESEAPVQQNYAYPNAGYSDRLGPSVNLSRILQN